MVWVAKNRIDFFAVLLACLEHGLILLPLNWQESASVQQSMLQRLQPRFLLAESLFETTVGALADRLGVDWQSIDAVLAAPCTGAAPATLQVSTERPWYLLYTSGTTGHSKAVMHSWNMARANAQNLVDMIGLSAADTGLSVLPHYHTAGINLFALPLLLLGGEVIVRREPEARALLTLMQQGRVSTLLLVPTLWQRVADLAEFQSLQQGALTLRVAASGGAALSNETIAAWAEQGITLRNGCGMTESGPTLFLQTELEAQQSPTAIGHPVPGTEVRLCGVDGSVVDAGESGEICIRGAAVTPGYWGNAAANAQAFKDGWFHTGDIARFRDGQYWLIERLSDMYICGGENVYPSEVEDVLLACPGVREVVVMGTPHRVWGEVGVALVLTDPSMSLSSENLLSWCKARLARYKVPKTIRFVDEFPTTATGKIRRGLVRDWVRG